MAWKDPDALDHAHRSICLEAQLIPPMTIRLGMMGEMSHCMYNYHIHQLIKGWQGWKLHRWELDPRGVIYKICAARGASEPGCKSCKIYKPIEKVVTDITCAVSRMVLYILIASLFEIHIAKVRAPLYMILATSSDHNGHGKAGHGRKSRACHGIFDVCNMNGCGGWWTCGLHVSSSRPNGPPA
jgi:hypothetical protein